MTSRIRTNRIGFYRSHDSVHQSVGGECTNKHLQGKEIENKTSNQNTYKSQNQINNYVICINLFKSNNVMQPDQ